MASARHELAMASTEERAGASTVPPVSARWPVETWLAPVPLILGALVLELLGPTGAPLTKSELSALHGLVAATPFFAGGLTYAAVVMAHVGVCLAAIVYFGLVMADLPAPQRRRSIIVSGALSLAVLSGLLMLARPEFVAYRLTYFNYAEIFRGSSVEAVMLAPRLFGFSALSLAVYGPTALGVIAVIAGATVASAQRPGRAPSEFETGTADRNAGQRLGHCLYLLSAVLVTSTIAASFFFHLPGKVFASTGSDVAATLLSLREYADELTLFWAVIFTLTLVAAVAWPMWRLQHGGHALLATASSTDTAAAAPAPHSLKQLQQLLLILAPLISGPLANMVQSVAAA